MKNILAAIAVISIFRDIKKLNENIFYNFINLKGRGDISKIRINRKIIKFIDESYNTNPLSVNSAMKNFDLTKKSLGKFLSKEYSKKLMLK